MDEPSGSKTPLFTSLPRTTESMTAGVNCGSEKTHRAFPEDKVLRIAIKVLAPGFRSGLTVKCPNCFKPEIILEVTVCIMENVVALRTNIF